MSFHMRVCANTYCTLTMNQSHASSPIRWMVEKMSQLPKLPKLLKLSMRLKFGRQNRGTRGGATICFGSGLDAVGQVKSGRHNFDCKLVQQVLDGVVWCLIQEKKCLHLQIQLILLTHFLPIGAVVVEVAVRLL